MKNEKVLNILTILALAATLILIVIFLSIFLNPQSETNPLRPPTLPAVMELPTATPTLRQLPPTWTPTPQVQGLLLETPQPPTN